jgi:signal transduction histidine kinase
MRPNPTPNEIFDPCFLQSIVQHATHLLDCDGSGFYFWDSERGHAKVMAVHNLAGIPWDESLPGRVIESREVVSEKIPGRSVLLAAPAALHDDVLGVLVVVDWNPGRVFRDRDFTVLGAMADLAAAASRQSLRLARMTAQFRALHVIDLALSSSLEPDRVLNLILEKAVDLVGAEHGSLRELNPDTGELILKAHYGEGWDLETLAYTPRVGEGVMQWVAKHRRPYLCSNVQEDPNYVVLFKDMRSSVAIPLLTSHEDRVPADDFLGVLLLESSRQSAFDGQDVELLDALAQEAVIAIQNARQHQRLQSMHIRLKAEQEKRLAAEKWTVMGQAATSLAHRINNLIGIVPAGAAEVTRSLSKIHIPEGEREWVEANLGRIERNARFVLKLSNALFRPFKETGPPGRFDVNRLLNEALESSTFPQGVRIVRDYQEGIPFVESSKLLMDIFFELIINARKAMKQQDERTLTLRTRCKQDDEFRWVIVQIQDTGAGFSAEQMARMWDIFQQSKNGTGFGLWWIRTFIERHGGSVECRSVPGKGSMFTLRLPVQANFDSHGEI